MLSSDSGKNVATMQHVRFHNGSWYYYTEEIRTGKNGIKALVLVGLRKSPGEKVASDQTSSAEAGSVRPKRLLAEAEERLRRSNEDFKSKHGERHGEQNENGDVSAGATQVFLDDGLGAGPWTRQVRGGGGLGGGRDSEQDLSQGLKEEMATGSQAEGRVELAAPQGADALSAVENQPSTSTHQSDLVNDAAGPDAGGTSFSVSPLRGDPVRRRNWKLQLNKLEANTLDTDKPLDVGETPEVLVATGAEQLPLVMDADVVSKAKEKHQLSVGQLRDIFDHLHAPTAVFQSAKVFDGMVVLTSMVHNGKPLIAAIHLDKIQQRHVVNKIESIYGKDTAGIRKWVEEGSLLYLDTERSPLLAQSIGLQLPKEATLQRGHKKVLTEADIVKGSNSAAENAHDSEGSDSPSYSIVPDNNQSSVDDQQRKTDTQRDEHTVTDPRTRQRSLVSGPYFDERARPALRDHNRRRLGQAQSLYREPEPSGAIEAKEGEESIEFAARRLGIPIVRLPDIGIVTDRYGVFRPADERRLKKLPAGSEAQPFLDKDQGVVYKVFAADEELGTGRKLSPRIDNAGQWEVGNSPASDLEALEKLALISDRGGLSTEIVGVTTRGYWVVKQPEARHVSEPEFEKARQEAVSAFGAVPLNSPGLEHVWVFMHEGKPWLLGDLHRQNIMKDSTGKARVMDALVCPMLEQMLIDLPAASEAVKRAEALGKR